MKRNVWINLLIAMLNCFLGIYLYEGKSLVCVAGAYLSLMLIIPIWYPIFNLFNFKFERKSREKCKFFFINVIIPFVFFVTSNSVVLHYMSIAKQNTGYLTCIYFEMALFLCIMVSFLVKKKFEKKENLLRKKIVIFLLSAALNFLLCFLSFSVMKRNVVFSFFVQFVWELILLPAFLANMILIDFSISKRYLINYLFFALLAWLICREYFLFEIIVNYPINLLQIDYEGVGLIQLKIIIPILIILISGINFYILKLLDSRRKKGTKLC